MLGNSEHGQSKDENPGQFGARILKHKGDLGIPGEVTQFLETNS